MMATHVLSMMCVTQAIVFPEKCSSIVVSAMRTATMATICVPRTPALTTNVRMSLRGIQLVAGTRSVMVGRIAPLVRVIAVPVAEMVRVRVVKIARIVPVIAVLVVEMGFAIMVKRRVPVPRTARLGVARGALAGLQDVADVHVRAAFVEWMDFAAALRGTRFV
jgi:hypothetical protein